MGCQALRHFWVLVACHCHAAKANEQSRGPQQKMGAGKAEQKVSGCQETGQGHLKATWMLARM